jgi:multidrug efflux pump subunit AcrA (membrane-fusion protein)
VLTAPFDGVIATVDVAVGDDAAAASISLIDTDSYVIELSLSESDVAAVEIGHPVTLAFDALPDLAVSGIVQTIAPAASIQQNVATYPVQVVFAAPDSAVRVGMSTSGEIHVASAAEAVLVPTRALTSTPDGTLLRVRHADGNEESIRVETGLAADGRTEIIACVESGDQCLADGDDVVVPAARSSSTTAATFGPGGGFAPGGRP